MEQKTSVSAATAAVAFIRFASAAARLRTPSKSSVSSSVILLSRRQYLLFVLLKLGGDEALASREGLSSRVILGNERELRFRNLYVVAEHPVVADL